MIEREVIENIEVIDTANKLNHNDYTKTLKIFGFKVYSYRYKMRTTVNEKKNSEIGFSKEK